MFNKMTTFCIDKNSFEVIDNELIKTAAVKLPDGVEYDPDFFYIKVRAVSAGEYYGSNKNADFFPEIELKKYYKTFLTAHTFKNHNNKDVANAIGDVLFAEWNEKMKGVDLIIRIDRRIAPTVVRGFEKGFMTDVSMGCRIDYSICSICGNKAKIRTDYCDHIKYMRNKIMPDGKKVYEINIGPKFHDISAVLNGAERAAKVTGMIIMGTKVAIAMSGTEVEKVASFEESIGQDSIANQLKSKSVSLDLDSMEILASCAPMYKKSSVQKIAEIKKQIQGKIVSLAEGEAVNDRMQKAEDVFKTLKLLYEKYWDKEKCSNIADQIAMIAKRNGVPEEVAFNQFLKVLDFAGIELSPLEFHNIFYHLTGKDTPNLPDNILPSDNCEYPTFMDRISERVDSNSLNIDLPSLLSTIRSNILPNKDLVISKLTNNNPLNQLKAVIIKVRKTTPDNADYIENELMDNVVSPLMPERSYHHRFINNRLQKIANSETEPNYNNIVHFVPIAALNSQIVKNASFMPYVLSSIAYSNYENDRVERIQSGDMEYGLTKFASYIEGDSFNNILNEYAVEKTATEKAFKGYTRTRSLLYGVPVSYGYSALQRARIENGENVSGANRFVADNPGAVAAGQVIFAPKINRVAKKGAKVAGKFLKSLVQAPPKIASEDLINYVFSKDTEKYARVGSEFYKGDMFKDARIHTTLAEKYNNNQIQALKYACILTSMDRQDLADNILAVGKLAGDDISQYLQTCKDCIRLEIEKNAGEIAKNAGEIAKNTALNTAGDIFFNPAGASVLATLPGSIIDGAIFAKLNSKNKKPTKLQSDGL